VLQFLINLLSYDHSFSIKTLLILPFMMMFMYFGICWFNRHILLNQVIAFLCSSFSFVFSYICVMVFLFSEKSPWRWPHEWPKHVGDYNTIKVHQSSLNAFVGSLIHFMHLSYVTNNCIVNWISNTSEII